MAVHGKQKKDCHCCCCCCPFLWNQWPLLLMVLSGNRRRQARTTAIGRWREEGAKSVSSTADLHGDLTCMKLLFVCQHVLLIKTCSSQKVNSLELMLCSTMQRSKKKKKLLLLRSTSILPCVYGSQKHWSLLHPNGLDGLADTVQANIDNYN